MVSLVKTEVIQWLSETESSLNWWVSFDKPTKAIIVGTKSNDIQIRKLKPAGKEIDALLFGMD